MSRRRDDLRALFAGGDSAPSDEAPEQKALVPTFVRPDNPPVPAPRAASGALKAMGLELDGLRRAAAEADALKDALHAGERVLELNPSLVDAAFVRDRMMGDPAEDAALEASLAASGQQVPILVRPHREKPGRYEAAYGHRRLAALQRLGRPVRAVVRTMDDDQLVIAQGQENNQRLDLSFIEKARYAAALDGRGFARGTIVAALDAHTADITRYLNVANGVPDALIAAIGPAPRTGRPRWMALAAALGGRRVPQSLEPVLADPAFRSLPSDERFAAVMEALAPPRPRPAAPRPALWRSPDGAVGVELRASGGEGADFAAFVEARLDGLLEEFRARPARPS